jgi:hypothetical protein
LEITGGTTYWDGGSTIVFEFIDVDGGIPGVDWDFLNMSSSVLEISASVSNKITLLIDSFNADNSGHGGGPGANYNGFDPLGTYSWLFASTAGLSPDLDTAALQSVFNIVADSPGGGVFGSGNPYSSMGAGQFNIVRNGDDLYLNYGGGTAIPEPSSMLLSGLAAAGFGWRLRRRRRAAAASGSPAITMSETLIRGGNDEVGVTPA